jgi:thiamine-phosphate pyrophosphorylase
MLRYAITEGFRFGNGVEARLAGLMEDARRWAGAGLDFVQLREKTLKAAEVLRLAEAMLGVFAEAGGTTKLLLSSRADVALAAGADGVHLTAHPEELTPEQVRRLYALSGMQEPVVSASCHTVSDVLRARDGGATLALFGPVFGKTVRGQAVQAGVGLEALREACAAAGAMPLLALGGVTADTAEACVEAGAAGVAGIRLFQ